MPVVEDSDQVLPLLKVGDEVVTPEGPGVLTSVQFQTAQYNGRWELEPPLLEVELDSGETVHTCLCRVELPGTEKGTRLLHLEFNRLWPPKTDDVPEDADSMIPEGDEPEEEVVREGLKEATPMRREPELHEDELEDDRDRDAAERREILRRPLRRKANVLDDVDDDHLRASVAELMRDEDLDPEDFEGSQVGPAVVEVRPAGRAWEPEYTVVESYDEAYKYAVDMVREMLYDDPSSFRQSWLQYYIDEDHLRRELYSGEFDSIYEDMTYEIDTGGLEDVADQMDLGDVFDQQDAIRAELQALDREDLADRLSIDPELYDDPKDLQTDIDEMTEEYIEEFAEDRLEKLVRDRLDDYVDELVKDRLRDPVAWLQDIFGDQEGIEKAMEIGGIDYDRAADEAVNVDGPGHFLGHYDGELHELDTGAVYYRTN